MKLVRDALYRVFADLESNANAAHDRLAALRVGEIEDALPGLDRSLRALFEAADGAKRYLTLYRESVHALYDPIAAARAQSAHLVGPSLASMMAKHFTGDSEQVTECLRLVVDNGKLDHGGAISLAVHPDGHPPRIEVHVNDAASLPDVFTLAGGFEIPFDELSERWNGATDGGRVETGRGGLVMNLRGTRRPPEACPWANHVLAPASQLVRILMPWRGAIGHFEHGSGANEETRTLYAQSLKKAAAAIKQAKSQIPNETP